MTDEKVKTKEEDEEEEKIKPEKILNKSIQEKFAVSDKCHIIMEA